MADQFLPVSPDDSLFQFARDGRVVGIVWRGKEGWHADPYNLADPKITEPTREAAAARL